MDPVREILKANSRTVKISKEMNLKLVAICERCELDRPILMRDKLDLLWNNKDSSKGEDTL